MLITAPLTAHPTGRQSTPHTMFVQILKDADALLAATSIGHGDRDAVHLLGACAREGVNLVAAYHPGDTAYEPVSALAAQGGHEFDLAFQQLAAWLPDITAVREHITSGRAAVAQALTAVDALDAHK
jgi:hypothetical protein